MKVSGLKHNWEVGNSEYRQLFPRVGLWCEEEEEMWIIEVLLFGVIYLFKGRRDLYLFQCHWEGRHLRERLNNAGKRKDSLFNKYSVPTLCLGIPRCWEFREENRGKSLVIEFTFY